jgi:hypothetical protein
LVAVDWVEGLNFEDLQELSGIELRKY